MYINVDKIRQKEYSVFLCSISPNPPMLLMPLKYYVKSPDKIYSAIPSPNIVSLVVQYAIVVLAFGEGVVCAASRTQ
jgi:hypothetical protein